MAHKIILHSYRNHTITTLKLILYWNFITSDETKKIKTVWKTHIRNYYDIF